MFDKNLLYPPFVKKLIVFEAKLQSVNLPFHGFCGWRTFDQQEALYDQGRTKKGSIVTKAKPGYSFHNYGVAADYVPYVNGSWNWNVDKKLWEHMAKIAETECDLEAAFFWKSFPEGPHVQLKGLPKVDVLFNLYNKGGLSLVWAELDKSFKFDFV